MDKLVGWDLSGKNSDKCSRCGMDKSKSHKKGCCKDEQKQVKLHDDQKVTDNSISLMQLSSQANPVTFDIYKIGAIQFITHRFPVTHSPPRHVNVPDYLFNCIFLI